jgi:hypothetical protein
LHALPSTAEFNVGAFAELGPMLGFFLILGPNRWLFEMAIFAQNKAIRAAKLKHNFL